MTRLKPPLPSRPRTSQPKLGRWQLQDAKARFSEVVRSARDEGPQIVTVHGRDEVVVVAADDYRRLSGERSGALLVEAMQASPHRRTELAPRRARMPVRDVDLSS
ncbi:type II toxin-antitoxin system Phd/YefM family antitoxin [Rhodopseudomonas sp. HC1]|uniref:type II toxin-antitoxin system Phd/YefM family antitoxin n=1 Tax=Rhodopseudomonas infernalis TaxID=2897386 RepID=UPI001EE81EC5|nr:type II toxin-antitoxin system Phd/YefM family antitoxin [Rhodopseudomonas infernalis]MCG6205117.1 type II toxin-antitoxin system Phd/YefM family antitoxin [Rhodopseudomonas infernalis]